MKRLWLLLVAFAVVIVVAAILRSRTRPTGIGVKPEIVSFTATPPATQPGQPVTLAWSASGTPSLTMNWATKGHPDATLPEHTRLPASGKMTVKPKRETTYRLTCETADGPMCTTSLTVRTE